MEHTGNPQSGPNPPSPPERQTLDSLSLPLRECGEIAILRLSAALSEALELATDQLFNDATQAVTPQERDSCVDAAEFARLRRHALVCDFMRHFEQRYIRACLQKHDVLARGRIDFEVSELKVVEHYLLDDSLDPGKIAEAIQNTSWQTLQRLTAQFQLMLRSQYIMPIDLPLGPKVIEAAVSDAIREQPWRQTTKPRLAKALRWTLASRVGLFYRDLADHLNARDLRLYGPGPRQPAEVPPPAATPRPAAPPSAREPGTDASSPGSGQPRPAVPRPEPRPEPPASVPEADPANSLNPVMLALRKVRLGVPGMLRRLNQGLESLPLAREARRDRPARPRAEAEAGPPVPDPSPAGARPHQEDSPPSPVASQEALVQVAPPPLMEATEDAAVSPRQDEALQDVHVGEWLSFQAPGGALMEVKLAWISPRRSLFLFTNRNGERALSLSAADFAAAWDQGRIRRLPGEDAAVPFPVTAEAARRRT